MIVKLKPCPFCGSEDISVIDWSTDDENPSYCGWCSLCNTEGPINESKDEAAEAWNKRKIPNVQYAEVLVEWMKDPEFKEEYTALQTIFERLVDKIVEEERKRGS